MLTAWVQSKTWTSFSVPRSDLRIVTDAEFEGCRKKYNDAPLIRPPLSAETTVKPGDSLLCKISDYWLPVTATGPERDDGVPISWVGFSEQFDGTVDRDRLALTHRGAIAVARVTTSRPDVPGVEVTADTELRPGQKLAGKWGQKWYKVVVTGFSRERVLTAWVHSNTWTSYSMQRENLRLVTDEEFARCLKKYNDTPKVPAALPQEATITPDKKYVCEVSGYWLPVDVMGQEVDGKVLLHWQGFGDQFDEHADRGRIRLQPGR